MKKLLYIFCLFLSQEILCQEYTLAPHLQNTLVGSLGKIDSLVYYQCHVELLQQNITTASGQSLSPSAEKYSITEKFVLYKADSNYVLKQYVSSMLILPNRRFSGLKIREKAYWNFKSVNEKKLSAKDVKLLAALELKGKEPTEYEFAITKYNTNQMIVKKNKSFRQLNLGETHLISKLIMQ